MRKLPFLRLARHAHLDVLGNAGELAQAAGLWVLAAWVLTAIGNAGLALVADFAASLGVSAVAVAWHRRLILAEQVRRPAAPLDARVGRYLLYTLMLTMVVVLPGIVALQLTFQTGAADAGPSLMGALIAIVAVVAGLYASMRLQLVFPGAAVADPRTSLGASWAATAGNGWRLCLGFLLTTIPVTLLGTAMALGMGMLAAATDSFVLTALSALLPIVTVFIQASLLAAFLSFTYLFLVNPPPREEPAGDGGGMLPAA